MKIAYVFPAADRRRMLGVARKIADQLQTWARLGHEPRLFLQASGSEGASEALLRATGVPVLVLADAGVTGGRLLQAVIQRGRTVRALVRAVTTWEPDVIYLRYTFSYPALAAMARRIPTVLEINTDDLSEYATTQPRYKRWYHRLTRGRLLHAARGMVFVTRELAALRSYRVNGARTAIIANGVDLAAGPGFPAAPQARPRLVFIGEPGQPWHGVDLVLELATLTPEWEFDIVGYGPADIEGHAPPNVTLHGYLPPDRYGAVLGAADVAVGSLALYRKRMDEACPLKVREYLAGGIPTVVGYQDTDFPDGAPFLLQLPNAPGSVTANLEVIRAFVARVRGTRVSREDVAHLDVRRKEAQRLAFLAAVAEV